MISASAARDAKFLFTERALDWSGQVGFADEACLSALVQAVIAVGGLWSDVELLCDEEEPAFPWLNRYHARTVWDVFTAGEQSTQIAGVAA